MQVAHLWKSPDHLAPFLATSVQAAEALIDVETGFPAALAEPGYHKSQSGSRRVILTKDRPVKLASKLSGHMCPFHHEGKPWRT